MYDTWSQAGEEQGPPQEGMWRRRWSTEPPERSLGQVPGLGGVPIILIASICIQGRVFFSTNEVQIVPIFSYRDLRPSVKYFTTDDGYNVLMVARQCKNACWCSSMATRMNYLDCHLQMFRWYSMTRDSNTRILIYRCVSPTYKWCNDASNPCTHRGRTKSNVANLYEHVFTTFHCKKHKMEKVLMFLSRARTLT